jgi:hypothetical protein
MANAEQAFLRQLERHSERLRAADAPPELFRRLLEAAATTGPRVAVFLVRQGQIKGWGSNGHAPDVADRQRSFSCPEGSGWLGRLVSGARWVHELRPAVGDPDFGQELPTESVGVPVRVAGRAVALLLAERTGEEAPWFPPALAMLGRIAGMRLELDLLGRKRQDGVAARDPHGAPDGPAVTSSDGTVPSTPPAAAEEALRASSPQGGRIATARRFARLLAADIRLYNEATVELGLRAGDLGQRLRDQLERGAQVFLERHGSLGPDALRILREAYVDVLANGDDSLLPPLEDG